MLTDTLKDNFFSGQGEVLIALRASDGTPGPFFRVGNCPSANVKFTVERRKHKESRSGKRIVDKIQTTVKGGTVEMTVEDIRKDNVALLLAGNKVTLASGSYTSGSPDTFPSGLVVDSIVKLRRPNASSIVIKDSAGTPVTLTLNTHYRVVDAAHGLIEILSLGSLTQPFKAEYSYASTDVVTALEASDDSEYFVYFAITNTEPTTDQPIGVEAFRVVFNPTELMALINEEQGTFNLVGEVLRDPTRADDSNYGGFARFVYVRANV